VIAESAGLLRWQQPSAGYTAWVQLPAGVQAAPFCRHLAQERAVLLLPGTVFGPRYEGFVRIGFGGDAHTLDAGLEILRAELASFAAQA
jgi:aspartate/methionine/tyrosine aminotransferase